MSVVDYLIKYEGMPPERLGVAAFGEYHPRVPNDTPEHRAVNRRIEIGQAVAVRVDEDHFGQRHDRARAQRVGHRQRDSVR